MALLFCPSRCGFYHSALLFVHYIVLRVFFCPFSALFSAVFSLPSSSAIYHARLRNRRENEINEHKYSHSENGKQWNAPKTRCFFPVRLLFGWNILSLMNIGRQVYTTTKMQQMYRGKKTNKVTYLRKQCKLRFATAISSTTAAAAAVVVCLSQF